MTTRKQRRSRLTLGLGVLVLGLGIAIASVIWRDRQRVAESVFLGESVESDARRIEIELPGRDTLILTRQMSAWQIESPCVIAADAQRVNPLLQVLATSPLTYPAGEVDLEAAGLLDPEATITIDADSVILGGTDLSGERRYAQRGDDVALVPEWVLSLANGGLSALAVKRLFPTPPAALTTVSGRTLELTVWSDLTANQILDWPIADAPDATQTARLEARSDTGEVTTFDIVANDTWTAIVVADSGCARLFANDVVPADAFR